MIVSAVLAAGMAPAMAAPSDLDTYPTYEKISAELGDLASANAGLVTMSSVGRSYEERDIPAVTIGAPDGTKSELLLVCGLQPRAWVAPVTCVNLARRLAADYASDPQLAALIDAHPVHIVPVLNVDGYVYTHNDNRQWAKNRMPDGTCTGVNLDRNFGVGFGSGASTSPCSDTYMGRSAFSAPETAALRDFVATRNAKAAITFDAPDQQVLYPPAGADLPSSPRAGTYEQVASEMAGAMGAVHEQQYTSGQYGQTRQAAGGTLVDYLDDQGVLSFQVMLRDKGEFGVALPASQIGATTDEAAAAMKVLLANTP